jgi:hypothetical protein
LDSPEVTGDALEGRQRARFQRALQLLEQRGVTQAMLITETTTTLPLEGTRKRLPEGDKEN